MVYPVDITLDKKYVHKKLQENVFIKNLRRSIPSYIEKETAENLIIPALSLADRAVFLEYYLLPESGECYEIFNVPHMLDPRIIDGKVNLMQLPGKDMDILSGLYHIDGKDGNYKLKKYLSGPEEKVLKSILGVHGVNLPDSERAFISRILESVQELKKDDVFYANMEVNSSHSFFFEHTQEHVPGIMILEAARQMVTACGHIFGKIPLQGYQFVLNQLNSRFMNFVDPNYPVEMVVELTQLETKKNGEWEFIIFKVSVFQKNFLCAIIDIDSRSVNKKIFKRIRKGIKDAPSLRFYPVNPDNCPVSLWSPDMKSYYIGRLEDLSALGFSVEFEEKPEGPGTDYEFVMHFQEIGFIRGKCRRIWMNGRNDSYYCGFNILEAEKADIEHLEDAIKRYCQLRVDREQHEEN